jgi:hypothetical protein
MSWVKIRDLVINLNNVGYIERFGSKVVIHPAIELDLKDIEKAKEFFKLLIDLAKKENNLIDLTDFIKEK